MHAVFRQNVCWDAVRRHMNFLAGFGQFDGEIVVLVFRQFGHREIFKVTVFFRHPCRFGRVHHRLHVDIGTTGIDMGAVFHLAHDGVEISAGLFIRHMQMHLVGPRNLLEHVQIAR